MRSRGDTESTYDGKIRTWSETASVIQKKQSVGYGRGENPAIMNQEYS